MKEILLIDLTNERNDNDDSVIYDDILTTNVIHITKNMDTLNCKRNEENNNSKSIDDEELKQFLKRKREIKDYQLVYKKKLKSIDSEYGYLMQRKQICKTNLRKLSIWGTQLRNEKFRAAPVSLFTHLPFSQHWNVFNDKNQLLIEVPLLTNFLMTSTKSIDELDNEIKNFPGEFYWIAWVKRVVGMIAMLRYEGFMDGKYDFWISLYNEHVHPLGWTSKNKKILMCPKAIIKKQQNWKTHLKCLFMSSPTISNAFQENILQYKSRFRIGHYVEVIDCHQMNQMKLAKVINIIGNRLTLEYCDNSKLTFCCSQDSQLIHPIGWSFKIGHNILAPINYYEKCKFGQFHENDAGWDLFQIPNNNDSHDYKVGMKLEAKDPLNLKQITVASIEKVLDDGYLMLRFENSHYKELFCYHSSSPDIFPIGFCETYHIPLTPPLNEKNFNWENYLIKNNYKQVPRIYFNNKIPKHGFNVGMKLECADLTFPHLICMASISQIAGRMLKIHFDGWSENFDQWLDCQSPDIYPVGWCEYFGHHLQGPSFSSSYNPNIKKNKNH